MADLILGEDWSIDLHSLCIELAIQRNAYLDFQYTEGTGGMVLLSLNLAGQRQGRMSVLLHRTAFQRSMTRQSLPCVIESLWSAGNSYNGK